ncbi:MAG: flagellar biosynthesis anti-sigma factor FlgM [Deltaproteobacteria bacterium]|nr:flagellar biosynthesis anti-sigma factor FlgM [Deltaproteobacteria bacterium]
MKVSGIRNPISEIIQQYQANGQVNPESDKQAGINTVQEEKVSLSAKGRDIQQARKAINNLPDVRTEKVEDLRNQIEQGTYHVNSEEIAEKMIGESLIDVIA